jgi:FkbM family methyltransferase
VIDAGANIGTHSLVYAKTAEKVLAFEPQISTYKLLTMNAVLNSADNLFPYWCALGAENGMVHIPAPSPDEQYSWGGVECGEGDDLVLMRTLDSLPVGPVSFIKIDVETYVLDVLMGAIETIQKYKPVMYVENNFGEEASKAIIAFVEGLGYTWELYTVPAFPKDNYYGNTKDIYTPGCKNVNMLCLPRR